MPYIKAENAGPIEIYYEVNGSGAPAVLIGGFTSTIEIWGLQVPFLTEHYLVITPDNRGSGRMRLAKDYGVHTPSAFGMSWPSSPFRRLCSPATLIFWCRRKTADSSPSASQARTSPYPGKRANFLH